MESEETTQARNDKPWNQGEGAFASMDPVVTEARRRFDRVEEYESTWRQRYLKDLRFAEGDSENGYQWPNEIKNARDTSARPCLTINLIKQHNRMISNTARKNKSTVKYIGVGNGATQETANVFRDLHRYIEYQSSAQASAYEIARYGQITGGIGWFRLVTDYESDTFDQEIFIHPVNDPLSVYMDPDIKLQSGLDAMWAHVFDDVPKDEFYEAYPDVWGKIGGQPLNLGTVSGDWISKHKVRVCEYFRKVPKEHELVSFVHRGQRHTIKRAKLDQLVSNARARKVILDDPTTRIRDHVEHEVEWYLIAGDQVVDKTTWLGKYIPLIRVPGEETVIEGILDRKGHTRAMLDAQRMLNFNASAQVEFVALQSKTPWVAAAKAIEEYEALWNTANINNASVLPWNHVDPENPDQPIPPPQRIEPPTASPAYQLGMETARTQMMMASGQYQNQLGEQGNERTGAAIQKRQDQSDTATYHFQDNYENSLVTLGKMLIDLIPKVYDTKRVKKIIADDGTEYELELDPSLREGYLEKQAHDGTVIKRVFNPTVGKYDIAASVGPDFGSKRDETREALTLILTQAPGLTGLIGDLLMKSMDFEYADEAAMRLRRMLPPQATGKGPNPNEQQLMQQVAALQTQLTKLMDKNAKDSIKLAGKAELRDIEAYDAETKRMGALAKMLPTDPEGLRSLIEQLVHDSLSTGINSVLKANAPELGEQAGDEPAPAPEAHPVIPGAYKAPDGEFYLTDPTRHGKYLKIAPLAQEHKVPGVIG